MGSGSTKKKSAVPSQIPVQHKSLRNDCSSLMTAKTSCNSTVTMAECKDKTERCSDQKQTPTSPYLPVLQKTPEGAFIPQTPSIQDEAEGYVTTHTLYNLINDGFLLPFIHVPEYMLILDTREQGQFSEAHILTARPYTSIDTDSDCLLESGKFKKFTHIVLYDDCSTVKDTSSMLTSLVERLRAQDLDPVILAGGFQAFFATYPFLCNDRIIRSERERVREIRTYPSEILEGALYQGNAKHAASLDVIKNLRITHVVNISTECENSFEGTCVYLNLKYSDVLGSYLKHRLPKAADFIADALCNGGRVLVHCVEGISRSSTITLAFMMKYLAWTLADGIKFLQTKRPYGRPNRAFLMQLGDLEKDLFGKKISDVDEIWMNE